VDFVADLVDVVVREVVVVIGEDAAETVVETEGTEEVVVEVAEVVDEEPKRRKSGCLLLNWVAS
jgi:hypothetical protein